MKPIQTAIIGFGMAGQIFHSPALKDHPLFKVSHIMTRDPIKINHISNMDSTLVVVPNYEEILSNPEIDLIILATSNDVHAEYTKRALQANKHVVCEKPFVSSYQTACDLFRLAKNNKRILKVYHNRIYDGDMQTILHLIQNNRLGNIHSFHARFDRFVPSFIPNWRYSSGVMTGIFYDLAPHLIYDALALFGLPDRVSLDLFKDRPNLAFDDHFEMVLYYPNLTVYLGAQTRLRYPKPRFEITGDKASFVKYGFDQPDVNYQRNHHNSSGQFGLLYDDQGEKKIPIQMGKHYLFYDRLAHAIMGSQSIDLNIDLDMAVVYLMEQAIKSFKDKTPINLSIKEIKLHD